MEFFTAYNPMDRSYYSVPKEPNSQSAAEKIEEPIHAVREIGQSITEGSRFGTLIQSATAAIRKGTGTIELQPIMGGMQEPGGVESYGKEAREVLREMQRAVGMRFTSVHTPPQIGNLSGFHPERGFDDNMRMNSVEEIKKAINFSADVGGGAVVIHTGEFQRPITDQEWAVEKNPDGTVKKDKFGNKVYRFVGYQEEPGRAITFMVDDRTGRMLSEVRKSDIIREPVYKEAQNEYTDSKGRYVKKGDWIDLNDNYIDPADYEDLFMRVPLWDEKLDRFKTRQLIWNDIEERTDKFNREHPEQKKTPEEMAFRIQMETQMLQQRGYSLYRGQMYQDAIKARDALKEALSFYEKVEKNMPPEERWKMFKRIVPGEMRHIGKAAEFILSEEKMPSEIIKKELEDIEKSMKEMHESSASADAQADKIQDTLNHTLPVKDYAIEQSMRSYAEAGIYAMQQSHKNPNAKHDVFVAPENIFPEMGYGSHPEEMIELVNKARESMIKYLTSEEIDDIHGRRDREGNLLKIENPYYNPGLTPEQAAKEAENHIKATLDTQHLGMWRKHFMPRAGETKDDSDKRFKEWYMEMIKRMHDQKIIGHIHLVDSLGGGHHHLPVGQGDLPLVDAITYLKRKGYTGTIISEAYEDERFGEGRILTETWAAFGSPVYSTFFGGHGPRLWQNVQHGYYGQTQPPMFIYGAYSPSNDWTLWSEVPME